MICLQEQALLVTNRMHWHMSCILVVWHYKRYGQLKMIYVVYDPDKPELMEKIVEHWRHHVTITVNEKVQAKILEEWKAGSTKLIMYEEVIECLSQLGLD